MQIPFAPAFSSDDDVQLMRGGAGRPVLSVRSDRRAEPDPFDHLLAQTCDLTLASAGTPASRSAQGLKRMVAEAGHDSCAIICDAASASAGIALALASPDLVTHLVLDTPDIAPDASLQQLDIPVLIVESSRVAEYSAGQKLAGVIPRSYHMYIYDAPAAAPTERAEAAAEVIGDFLERGSSFVLSKRAAVIHP